MTVVFPPRPPQIAANPDQLLMSLCTRWHALYNEWQRRLHHWYGDANHLHKIELQPLLERIAATPAETDQGFAAKLAIIVEDDLCCVVSSLCERMGTDCPGAMLIEPRELMSKGAPAKRGRPAR